MGERHDWKKEFNNWRMKNNKILGWKQTGIGGMLSNFLLFNSPEPDCLWRFISIIISRTLDWNCRISPSENFSNDGIIPLKNDACRFGYFSGADGIYNILMLLTYFTHVPDHHDAIVHAVAANTMVTKKMSRIIFINHKKHRKNEKKWISKFVGIFRKIEVARKGVSLL